MDRARQCATYHHDSHTMRSGEDLCSLAALVLRLEARLESAVKDRDSWREKAFKAKGFCDDSDKALAEMGERLASAERVVEAAKDWKKFGPEIVHDFKKCGCEEDVYFISPECGSYAAFYEALAAHSAAKEPKP